MRPIVESLFSELTLLGFIGLTLFLVFKMAWLKELSEKLYGEENELTMLCVMKLDKFTSAHKIGNQFR